LVKVTKKLLTFPLTTVTRKPCYRMENRAMH